MSYAALSNIVYAVGRMSEDRTVSLLGTATLLDRPGKFVTALHVTNKNDKDLVVVSKCYPSIHEYQDTSDTSLQCMSVKLEKVDPFTDLCILSTGGDHVSNATLGGTDILNTGNIVDVFGYPHADHGRLVLTQQRTEIGARILIKNQTIQTKHVVLNTQARPGQSGSPIFSANTTVIVAILIGSYAPSGSGGISLGGIDPHTLHQTTHAVSAEYIQAML